MESGKKLLVFDRKSTLIVLPCSGSKARGGSSDRGPAITDQLPSELAEQLLDAQRRRAGSAQLDESALLPALRRYTGTLYEAAGLTTSPAIMTGIHAIIVSGGYGVALATEPIGFYEAVFHLRDWPIGLLESCLVAYARGHRLSSVAAFMSSTTDYGKLIRQTPWRSAGIGAHLICPFLGGRKGAQKLVPRASGEALVAYLHGELRAGWTSSDGVGLLTEELSPIAGA